MASIPSKTVTVVREAVEVLIDRRLPYTKADISLPEILQFFVQPEDRGFVSRVNEDFIPDRYGYASNPMLTLKVNPNYYRETLGHYIAEYEAEVEVQAPRDLTMVFTLEPGNGGLMLPKYSHNVLLDPDGSLDPDVQAVKDRLVELWFFAEQYSRRKRQARVLIDECANMRKQDFAYNLAFLRAVPDLPWAKGVKMPRDVEMLDRLYVPAIHGVRTYLTACTLLPGNAPRSGGHKLRPATGTMGTIKCGSQRIRRY